MLSTPLLDDHKKLNGRLIEFAGWEMPVQYSGVIEEAKSVRAACGMFDVSHMGRVEIEGERVFEFLQMLTSNELRKLAENQGQYSLMCNEKGGVVDDIIVYQYNPKKFLIVWNSSNREKDMAWAVKHAKPFDDIKFLDKTLITAMIAVQGPTALGVIDLMTGQPLSQGVKFGITKCWIAGAEGLACRSGYTGEDGFEIIVPAEKASEVWNALLKNGVVPCGLAARDVLRVEAGLPLYGHELTDDINPIQAGLGWVVGKEKDFIGCKPIEKMRETGAPVKLVGLVMESKMVPRIGYEVQLEGKRIGEISSGVYSPVLDKGIAFAFVDAEYSAPDISVSVIVRDKPQPAKLTTKRFLKGR